MEEILYQFVFPETQIATLKFMKSETDKGMGVATGIDYITSSYEWDDKEKQMQSHYSFDHVKAKCFVVEVNKRFLVR